ncbi:uncharacterized protein LOC117170828 [Belonocnema kinseyi]|uniref:uncharacterized protein LOC117170828 n=1 Tax=Belonocnema kinseyi TaxID=2817044 RepID=UPI00143DD0A6|nr:uncharacterized protein LOC117170828 [Belonocnema kinseyi]
MTIDFYYFDPSPPCRTVMMLAKALGVHFNYIKVNPLEGDHMKPEFVKINPQRVIPTIDDNGLILCESRAILGYLVNKYAKNDHFYPKDPQKKGIIDQRLFFDIGTLYDLFFKCYGFVAFGMIEAAKEEDVQALERAFEILNVYFEDSQYVAGDEITIADFTIITSVCSMVECGFDISVYENVNDWYERCSKDFEKFGFKDINLTGARFIAGLYKSRVTRSNQLVGLVSATRPSYLLVAFVVLKFSDLQMPLDLYQTIYSTPCRAVRLVAAALGVDLNLKICDIRKGDQFKPEFIKMNPQHTIPTMDDNGLYLSESRAIMTYLADQYGKDDSLYPKDPKKRAFVDQRLYFDMGFYQLFKTYYRPTIFENKSKDTIDFEKLDTAFGFLEKFLEGENYVAGKNLTIADLALVCSVSTFEAMEYDFSNFMNIKQWYLKIKKEAPKYEEIVEEGVMEFKEMVASMKK